MKKLSVLIIGLVIPLASLALNDFHVLKMHNMIHLYGGNTSFSCEIDRNSMNMFLKEEDIEGYAKCTKAKKEEITEAVLKSNVYLTKNNYSKSKESLRKYYNSFIELLSIPPSSQFSKKSDIRMQNTIVETIERRIEVDWNSFIMDLQEDVAVEKGK